MWFLAKKVFTSNLKVLNTRIPVAKSQRSTNQSPKARNPKCNHKYTYYYYYYDDDYYYHYQ